MTDALRPTCHRSTLGRLGAVVLAMLLLAACGGDDGSGSVDQATTSSAAAVCNGEANDTAPEVTPGATPVAAYENAGDGWVFISLGLDVDDPRSPIIPEDAGLVACLEVTGSEVVEECEYEEEGTTFTLELADADYDISVRAAATGEELATGSVTASAGTCPTFTSFQEGETSRVQNAVPTDDVLALVEEAEAAA